MTAAMTGSAAIFYVMPTVAARYGAGALSVLLTVLGVIQGPLSAVYAVAQSMLHAEGS